ncbi:uncharacterized protein RSE6_02001 [Rhynchosporium secalis]|uniref:CENP-V/GFA domain-containing protein n=1 Tax=Rhynchosporium secalis TaxID=38038 RepID=A0A1E1LZ70_RHYSE|nr:uncharacterized protein RSE6_02001 [Rhynchosporium secalis]
MQLLNLSTLRGTLGSIPSDSVTITCTNVTDTNTSITNKIDTGTDFYVWGDKDLQFHRCRKCGCVMYWMPREGLREEHKLVSVNMRMVEEKILEGMKRVVKGGLKKE